MHDTDTETSQQLMVLSLGGEEYALPITRVHEIIRYSVPRWVVADVPWLRGVISLRGKIISVYDLATRLGLPSERSEHAKIVIVEAGGDLAGVIVDSVEEILSVEAAQLDELPTTSDGCIQAIAKLDDRLVIVLDADALLGVTADPAVLEAA